MSEWTDIGEQLRKAREGKDLELMDVAHKTRIPLAALSALEQNDYSVFPSPAYARSYLAQYSEYLDIDAHEWLDAFETGNILSNVNEHSYLQANHERIGEYHHGMESARSRGKLTKKHPQISAKSSGKSPVLQALTVFLVTALLIAGGIFAYKKYEPMLTHSDGDPDSTQDVAKDTDAVQAQEDTLSSNEGDGRLPKDPSLIPANPIVVLSQPPSSLIARNDIPTSAEIILKPEDAKNPAGLRGPTLIQPHRSGPPPKAMVIDEDEE